MQPSSHLARSASSAAAGICPFHDGPATLDALLAEIDPCDTELFDAALDLRSLATAGADPIACIEQLFRVRFLLGHRHYLAFYRVRLWARRTLRVEVRADRGEPWRARSLPLDGARVGEVVNGALADLAHDGVVPPFAHVRFSFIRPE